MEITVDDDAMPFFIIMAIFSGCIFFAGLEIYLNKKAYIPKQELVKDSAKQHKRTGLCTMSVSMSPVLAGLAAWRTGSMLLAGFIFLVTFIVPLKLALDATKKKKNHTEQEDSE